MGKDIRYDKGWGKKQRGNKGKRMANKKALKDSSDYRRPRRANPSTDSSKDYPYDESYIDPDDGFEKFENRY